MELVQESSHKQCKRQAVARYTPKGILDFDLTSSLWRLSKLEFPHGMPANARFESHVVGCLLSNDRLYAANLSETDKCRFCEQAQENLPHLLHCKGAHDCIGKPVFHELGENFPNLGIVEHPFRIAEHRLQYSNPDDLQVAAFEPSDAIAEFWTDGSVFWQEVYWLTTAGFAVINSQGECAFSGPVNAWKLSSYSAELWAIVVTVAFSCTAAIIYTDCKTIVTQFAEMLQCAHIPESWPHRPWWIFLHKIVQNRTRRCPHAARVCWIPAHLFESIPTELITAEMASGHNTSVRNIHMNRLADFAAKKAAAADAAVAPEAKEGLLKAIVNHQEWLTKLHFQLAGEDRITCVADVPEELAMPREFTMDDARKQFPQWPWGAAVSSYKWKAKIRNEAASPDSWFDDHNWEQFTDFCRHLRWKQDSSTCVAFVELAVLFHFRGYRFAHYDPGSTSFKDIVTWLRKVFQHVQSRPEESFFPGVIRSDKRKTIGKCLPTGVIDGGTILFADAELLFLFHVLSEGAGKQLSSWALIASEFSD